MTEHRGWDAYVSGTISIAILKHLLPDHIKADDAASEMHRCGFLPGPSTWADPCVVAFFRDRVHQVAYLRNSLAHPEPPPTLAEIVAGTMAMLEVLRDHGKLSAVQQIQSRLSALQEASWLQSGSVPPLPFCHPICRRVHQMCICWRPVIALLVAPCTVISAPCTHPKHTHDAGGSIASSMNHRSFAMMTLEQALGVFADQVGRELHAHWHPAHAAPQLPMEVAGKPSVINSLRNNNGKDGRNQSLKRWEAYWNWDWSQVQPALEQIERGRHELCHKAEPPLDVCSVETALLAMLLTCAELQLDPTELQALLGKLQALTGSDQAVEVTAEERGGMRIPFSDPRKYLVGRTSQLQRISQEVRSQLFWSRVLLHGESGTGKTVTTIALAFEVRVALYKL